jgi:hypothetical protein
MGSIQNLLNPLSTPSPRRRSPSKSSNTREPPVSAVPRPTENVTNPPQTPPSQNDRLSPSASRRYNIAQPGYLLESIQVERPQSSPSSDRVRSGSGGGVPLGEIRVLSPARGMKGVGAPDAGAGNRSRRTSTSSLADLLNPVETEPLPNVFSSTTQLTPEKSPSAGRVVSPIPPHHSPTLVVSPVAMEKIEENDEDMNIDIVGMEDDNPPTETNAAMQQGESVPMQKSTSTDSEATIDTPFSDLSIRKPPTPTPSTSRKRKFTPESSPDEPLAQEPPPQPETASSLKPSPSMPTETPIPVPAPKAAKKPRKPTVKRPPSAKKKPPVNGQKKRPVSAKDRAASLDDVIHFDVISNNILGIVNPTI